MFAWARPHGMGVASSSSHQIIRLSFHPCVLVAGTSFLLGTEKTPRPNRPRPAVSSSHHLCLTGIGKYIWSWHTWLSIWLTEGHAQQVALPNRHRPFGRSFYLAGCPCVLADESVLSHGWTASSCIIASYCQHSWAGSSSLALGPEDNPRPNRPRPA